MAVARVKYVCLKVSRAAKKGLILESATSSGSVSEGSIDSSL